MASSRKVAGWDQQRFDLTLRDYLGRIRKDKIPNALNKKAFFIALAAMDETPMTYPLKIVSELAREVTLKRDDGSTGQAPIGYAIAAKRASKAWGAHVKTLKRKSKLTGERWQKLVGKKFNAMLNARVASRNFIRTGWLSVIQSLAPIVKGKGGRTYDRHTVARRGSMKGFAKPAKDGWSPSVVIENTASAKSDKKYGLIRFGMPALQRAFDRETVDMAQYMNDEILKEETEKFNADQKR
jgi:hypothetical protein